MANRKNSIRNTPETFHKNYVINPKTQCWDWTPSMFRFAVGPTIHNPRRYSVQLSGVSIPPDKRIYPSCGNERCCNPRHITVAFGSQPINPQSKLYLRLNEFGYSDRYLANRYVVSIPQAAQARKRTLEAIVYVKRSNKQINELAKELMVPANFIKKILKISIDEFQLMKENPNVNEEPEFDEKKGMEFSL